VLHDEELPKIEYSVLLNVSVAIETVPLGPTRTAGGSFLSGKYVVVSDKEQAF
jgi:hypothetical protein